MDNETKIIISEEMLDDYRRSAAKWSKELLDIPIRTAQSVLQYMYGITGLRGDLHLPAVNAHAEFGPYDPDRKGAAEVNVDFRTLTTYFGNDVSVFHPNDYAMLTMGYTAPTLGEGQKKAPQTLLVLSQIAKARGEALASAVFYGKRNAKGTKTVDLFDGFVTIAEKEIASGAVSTAKGNLYEISDALTSYNACDILKDMVYSRNSYLRNTDAFLLCAPEVADRYNDSYLQSHPAVVYNQKFNQPVIEGSNGRYTIVALPELAGSGYAFLSPRENFLWGTDNRSDQSSVDIMREGHYRLSFAANIFFGVQFHTIDPRRLTVIKFAAGNTAAEPAAADGQSTVETQSSVADS
jgi:hypothetical protein